MFLEFDFLCQACFLGFHGLFVPDKTIGMLTMMCSMLGLTVRVILKLALCVLCLSVIKGLLRLHLLLVCLAEPLG